MKRKKMNYCLIRSSNYYYSTMNLKSSENSKMSYCLNLTCLMTTNLMIKKSSKMSYWNLNSRMMRKKNSTSLNWMKENLMSCWMKMKSYYYCLNSNLTNYLNLNLMRMKRIDYCSKTNY